MTCASTANEETCAYKVCCQPAVTEVCHRTTGNDYVVIGYCHRHAVKVLGYDPKQVTDAPA